MCDRRKNEHEVQLLYMENSLLQETILRQYKHSYKMKDLILFDGIEKVFLSSLLDDESYKLIVWFSEHQCSSCVDFVLKELALLPEEEFGDKLVVIGSFRHKRSYSDFVKDKGGFFPIYCEMDYLSEIDDLEDVPSLFLLDKKMEMKHLFYPIKEIPYMIHQYINIIRTNLKK